MDGPTFSERSEREVKPTDVHEVDHRNSTLGARQLRAAACSGSHRLERRDIKAENDVHFFCHIEATVPTI